MSGEGGKVRYKREKKGRAFSINPPSPTFINRGEGFSSSPPFRGLRNLVFPWCSMLKFYQVSLDEGIGRKVYSLSFFSLKILLFIKGEGGIETLESFYPFFQDN